MKRWIVPIAVLPGTVLVVIPAILLWQTWEREFASLASVAFWLGIGFLLAGTWFSGGAMRMFFRHGEGTPAPWDPPKRFVVRGLYRHCRNPMITGVIALLIGGALVLQSWPVAIWAAVFFLGNTIYFMRSEEPGLRRRFGEDYQVYCENVGRWIPRWKPWTAPWDPGMTKD